MSTAEKTHWVDKLWLQRTEAIENLEAELMCFESTLTSRQLDRWHSTGHVPRTIRHADAYSNYVAAKYAVEVLDKRFKFEVVK